MSKINKIARSKSFILVAVFAVFSAFIWAGTSYAQTVLQGYGSDESLQRGMLVSLKDGDESKVVALTQENTEKFKGVVVEQNESPVTISSDERQNFVATVGPYDMLVSDETGAIKPGDYLAVSSTPGIATKAKDYHTYVVGVAVTEFNGTGDVLSTAKTEDGQETHIGRVLADVAFAKNPYSSDPNKNKVPEVLKRIGESIADKPVTNFRLYLAITIFVGTAIISGTMLFSGIRSAVISIGRNPLSKASIYRGLFQVILFGLIIFLTGVFGVYLVLKL